MDFGRVLWLDTTGGTSLDDPEPITIIILFLAAKYTTAVDYVLWFMVFTSIQEQGHCAV